jgi:glutathione synthase/RimK-type ligase-like ATP-grasp enzyme
LAARHYSRWRPWLAGCVGALHMILLWGLPSDTPIVRVQEALARRGQASFFLDEQTTLETTVTLSAADGSAGTLRTDRATLELADITAVYQRPYGIDRIPALAGQPRNGASWQHAEAMTNALCNWLETTPALVVNVPSAMASNGSKPYQAQLIAALGLQVPATLVTTDADAVRAFRDRHGALIYKSVSGVRSIVSRLSDDKLDRLDLVRWCPTQFQEYIAGDDYRVHVVGEEVFACRIASQVDDYRYAARQGGQAELTACMLPADLADTCCRLAGALDLAVAGIDLRLDPERGWYCFEVNPSPAFTYFEDATGQEIGEAVARVLMAGG